MILRLDDDAENLYHCHERHLVPADDGEL
jgi:hypothetical protein